MNVPTGPDDVEDYDEFALLHETVAEVGEPGADFQPTRRVATDVAPGQTVAAIEWGGDPRPDLLFLPGAGQNAHTWDAVLARLARPALALDLPGHGHSDWRPDRDYSPRTNAHAVAAVIRARATAPVTVVGMSLGGLTGIALAAAYPQLVAALVIVDISPQSPVRAAAMNQAQRGAVALLSGPSTFDSFAAMADAAVAASPRRAPAAVRRGVQHNARRRPDGRWAWRYDQLDSPRDPADRVDYTLGWADLDRVDAPMVLVLGGESGFVTDADLAEMRRRRPGLRVQVVPDSGHSVQSDQPAALADILGAFVADRTSTTS